MWLVLDPWQAHFQVAFSLFQAETFYQIKSDKIPPWPRHIQKTQVQLQHMLFFWCGWRLLLAKYIVWPSWRHTVARPFMLVSVYRDFWVIILQYEPTGNFFFEGIKCFSMFLSPNKWYIFLGELSGCHQFLQIWECICLSN